MCIRYSYHWFFCLITLSFAIHLGVMEVCYVLHFMLQGLRPDVITYTTLMKALIRVEQFDKVRATLVSILSPCHDKLETTQIKILPTH